VSKALELRTERAALVAKMGELLVSGTPAALAQRKALDSQQARLASRIEDLERNDVARPNLSTTDKATAFSQRESVISSPEYRAAFGAWALTGDKSELRALGEGSALQGETLVPVGFQKEIQRYMRAYGNWYDLCRTVTTATGQELQWPVAYDTTSGSPQTGTWSNANWLAENTENSEEEPNFTNVTLYADKLESGLSRVSVELMQDSSFSMEGLLSEIFGQRLGYTKDNGLILGNGARITGLIPQLTAASTSSVASGNKVLAVGANANSANSGDTDLNSIGTADLSQLIQSVDPIYRASPSCAFLANQATFDKLRSQLDKYGRPLWTAGVSENAPDRIYGYQYRYSQNLSLIGAGNISMVFGDFSKYVVRDVLGITMVRFNELFMQYYQIGFQSYLRTFGTCLNPAAFSYLQHPDS
jgi:HK97 family phage major capsid protein